MYNWDELDFFRSTNFVEILSFLKKTKEKETILPSINDMFNAFIFTSFDEVKVVILGQDPYPDAKYAMGLAFSIPPQNKIYPKSLSNIYQELNNDLGIVRDNGSLIDWAEQGVLLLNTSLSVVSGNPGSHSKIGWHLLTNEVIVKLNDEKENLVFILWGQHAISKSEFIDSNKHFIIKSAHPSPLSAFRGFFGSQPFSKTNNFLISKNINPINW